MANRPPMPQLSGRSRLLVPFAVLVFVVLALLGSAVGLYTDLLWFQATGFTEVFTTLLGTRALLFVLFGAAMATVVGANIVIAYRLRPSFRPMSLEQQNLERYRSALEPRLLALLLLVSSIIGIFAGLAASARWQVWLQWRNAVPFGVADPQFGRDISYFAFIYPFQRLVLNYAFTAVVLALIAAAITHYLFGALRLQTPGEKFTHGARAHLAVLIGVFVLLKAVAYWLDRYGLAFSPRGTVTGASYTDVNAVLPAKTILAIVAVICALLFFGTVVRRGWLLPGAGLGLLVFAAVVVGGIVPAAVQQFQVKPNEPQKEQPYIKRNIESTRAAYGITADKVQVQQYDASAEPDQVAADLRSDAGTAPNTRLLDPSLLAPTFRQLQQIKAYYGFQDPLDIDRYDLGTGLTDYVVAARELSLDGLPLANRDWITDHLIYTHGRGFVAAPADRVNAQDGSPIFEVGNIPTKAPASLPIDQDRIYYGELSPEYSIAPSGQREIDGPGVTVVDGQSDQAVQPYQGNGGVLLSSYFRKVLYAIKYREANFLLSNAIQPNSRVLYDRDPRQRVEKVAPFLTLDGDPYPAIINKRVVWIVDGYTTSNGYPYSELQTLQDLTTDSLTSVAGRTPLPQEQINYIRNSVKATVDAYDGTVTLYAIDPTDPVLQTWRKAFPGVIRDASEVSSELRSHFRYPEDLFKVQRSLLTKYHVEDPLAFYNKEDFWTVPADPTSDSPAPQEQPPYYLFINVPGGEGGPQFELTTVFNAVNRPNLTAFLAVSSDPQNYGRIRLLRLPRDTNIPGPGQQAGQFKSNADVATTTNLLGQQKSKVTFGNLLTLPVGSSLLYVEPVYVSAATGERYPLLRYVIAGSGDNVAFQPTLQGAINELLTKQGARQTTPGNTNPPVSAGPNVPASPSAPPSGSIGTAEQLAAINQAFQDSQAALRSGDLRAYADAQDRLRQAIEAALASEGLSVGGGAASPAPSGAVTPAPSLAAAPAPAPGQSPSPAPSLAAEPAGSSSRPAAAAAAGRPAPRPSATSPA